MRRLHAIAVVAIFSALITLPLATQTLDGRQANDAWENRVLAPLPNWTGGLTRWTREAGAWLDDHFGLRRTLVQLNNWVRFTAFGESSNPQLAFGKNGELFFTSHTAQQPLALLDFLCSAGENAAAVDAMATGLVAFIDDASRVAPRTIYVIVPTKTVVQRENLPDWMQARCKSARPAVPAVLAKISASRPDVAARIDYPYETLRAMNGPERAYPKFNFHWDGEAPRRVAAEVARRFARPEFKALPTRNMRLRSDVRELLPGVPLRFVAREPDLAAAGVDACECVTELGQAGQLIGDASRFVRANARTPRLLILSDSFGKAIAPWFSAYYGEVWHISLTSLERLSPQQVIEVRRIMFNTFRPDDVVYVFHDFSVAYINDLLHRTFWTAPH